MTLEWKWFAIWGIALAIGVVWAWLGRHKFRDPVCDFLFTSGTNPRDSCVKCGHRVRDHIATWKVD